MMKTKSFTELIVWEKAHKLIFESCFLRSTKLLYSYKNAMLNLDSNIPNSHK